MNLPTSADSPRVTIVVSPRERFSVSRRSLESIYANTPEPFRLIYMDCGSPAYVRDWLKRESQARGFELLRFEEHMVPNRARNLAFPHVKTEYVCFIDNDALVDPGWLGAMIRCADESGAAVVAPLYLIGAREDNKIHMAGGKATREMRGPVHYFNEQHVLMDSPLLEWHGKLRRRETDYGEFHCMFMRSETLRKYGPLDEELKSALEHVDICIKMKDGGEKVVFEPASVVTYLSTAEFLLSDVPYFQRRWSTEWNRAAVTHFYRKWGFTFPQPTAQGMMNWLEKHRRVINIEPRRKTAAPAAPYLSTGHPYAQTNIQLYNQLRTLEFKEEQNQNIQKAYRLALLLHSEQIRANGKPFICHLVGVASVLAAHGAPAPMISAGLLHAIYESGRYRGKKIEHTDKTRADIAKQVGREVEGIIHAYHTPEYFAEKLPLDGEAFDRLPLVAAKALIVELANDVEETLDYGRAYSPNKVDPPACNAGLAVEKIARMLGYGLLYDEARARWSEMAAIQAAVPKPPLPARKKKAAA